jgi:hypothetical protein
MISYITVWLYDTFALLLGTPSCLQVGQNSQQTPFTSILVGFISRHTNYIESNIQAYFVYCLSRLCVTETPIYFYWFYSRQRQGAYSFSLTSNLALGPNQPSIQCVLGAVPPATKWQGRQPYYNPLLVPRSRMVGVILPLPNTTSWRDALHESKDKFIY